MLLTAAALKASVYYAPFLKYNWITAPTFAPWLLGFGRPDSVALTFDDGPDPISTPKVLKALEDHGVTATFFLLGEMVERHPQIAREILAHGHELGLHGFYHKSHLRRSTRSLRYDLGRSIAAIEAATGVRPAFFRPPYGIITRGTLVAAHAHSLRTVLWGTWGKDWRRRTTSVSLLADVRSRFKPGVTILLHDSDCTSYPGSFQPTIKAIPQLANLVRSEGLAFSTLSRHGI